VNRLITYDSCRRCLPALLSLVVVVCAFTPLGVRAFLFLLIASALV